MKQILRRWREESANQMRLLVHLVRWVLLGSMAGVLAGGSSFVFLEVLDRVTSIRLGHGWLVWLLPLAGLIVGTAYHYLGGRSAEGNSLLIEQVHNPTDWVPRRMAPLVLLGTWATHLFGGSAGREGTAVQMSGSLTDGAAQMLRLDRDDRRLLLIAALSGGFGAVFGVPLAGTVFGLEVQSVGRVRYEALVPALSASLVGDLMVGALGYHHATRSPLLLDLGWITAGKVAVAGLAFGLAGAAFAELAHLVQRTMSRRIPWAPLRPAIGGAAVVGLVLLFGRDYIGLSLPLIDDSLAGVRIGLEVFVLKIVFTAVTFGSGLPGGEVTPLFVVGATLGAALAVPLHLPVAALAAIGLVAVFAGAANTPLTCTIMGAELFGSHSVALIAIGCIVSFIFSSHRSIYPTQRVAAPTDL